MKVSFCSFFRFFCSEDLINFLFEFETFFRAFYAKFAVAIKVPMIIYFLVTTTKLKFSFKIFFVTSKTDDVFQQTKNRFNALKISKEKQLFLHWRNWYVTAPDSVNISKIFLLLGRGNDCYNKESFSWTIFLGNDFYIGFFCLSVY